MSIRVHCQDEIDDFIDELRVMVIRCDPEEGEVFAKAIEVIEQIQTELDAYKWVSVKGGLPENQKRMEVIVEIKNNNGNIVRLVSLAEYIGEKTVLAEDFLDDDYCEAFYKSGCKSGYDRETDTYWTPSGWYEYNLGAEAYMRIGDTVTHYRKVILPDIEPRQSKPV